MGPAKVVAGAAVAKTETKEDAAKLDLETSSGESSVNAEVQSELEGLRAKLKQAEDALEMQFSSYQIMENNLRAVTLRSERQSAEKKTAFPATGGTELASVVAKLRLENAALRKQVEAGVFVSSSGLGGVGMGVVRGMYSKSQGARRGLAGWISPFCSRSPRLHSHRTYQSKRSPSLCQLRVGAKGAELGQPCWARSSHGARARPWR